LDDTRTLEAERSGRTQGPAQSRGRLEIAVEAAKLGLWEWDLRTQEVTWSARNRQIFGLAPDAPVSLDRYLQLVHPDDIDEVRRTYRASREDPAGCGDFTLEHRVITPGGELRWVQVNGRVLADETGARLVVGATLEVTQRHAVEEQRSLLMGELAHRAKNGIAVMMAMVHQTARTAGSVKAFEASLTARLQAMADAQELVTATGGRAVLLSDIVGRTLAPFDTARFDVAQDLSTVSVAGDLAIGLALLLHEMGTNAVKYGALSNDAGRVALSCTADTPGRLALNWRERDGPRVAAVSREGFGTRLLQAALRHQGGRVDFSFESDGFTARVDFPHDG
jgi:PAS domain S-box-containing protein